MIWQVITIISSLLLAVKAFEMGLHCVHLLRNGGLSLTSNGNRNKTWPVTRLFRRIHLPHLYRLPVLVLISTGLVTSKTPTPAFALLAGATVFVAITVLLFQTFLSRLEFGDDDILFRRLSLQPPTVASASPVCDSGNVTRDYVMFILGLIGTIIVGYSCIFASIEQHEPGSFTATSWSYPPVDFLYFSTVTFATIGYGDIAPVKALARLAVISEIIASIISLVLLMFVYSTTITRLIPPTQGTTKKANKTRHSNRH